MRPVAQQAIANLRSHRLQAALISVTLFVAAVLLSLGAVARDSAGDAWLRLHQRTGEPHLWVYLDPRHVDPGEAHARLASLPGVDEVGPVMRSISVRALGVEGVFSNVEIREWPEPGVGVPLLVEGRAPRPGETNSVVLDRNLAEVQGFAVGDAFEVPLAPGGRLALRVVGLSVSAENCPHPICSPARVYAPPGTLAGLGIEPTASPNAVRDAVAVRVVHPSERGAVAESVDGVLPPGAVAEIADWEEIRDVTGVATSFQTLLFGAFGIVAALVAGILVANAVAGAVRSQTRHIGLLKAVGFTGRQLVGVYLLDYLGLALVAGFAGTGLGVFMAGPMLEPVTAQFGIDSPRIVAAETVTVALIVVLVTAVFTAWPVRRVARVDTVGAIRSGSESVRRRARSLPRLPISIAHGVAEVASRPGRAVLTGLGLLVAVVALVFVLSVNATMSSVWSDPEVTLYGDGDLLVLRSGLLGDEQARREVVSPPEVEAVMAEYWQEFGFPGEPERLNGRYLDGDVTAFRAPLIEGRLFTRHGEAVAGYGLAQERHLDVGDSITVRIADEGVRLRITGIVREFNNLGRMLTMPAETLRRIDPEAGPSNYVVRLRPGANAEEFGRSLTARTGGLLGSVPLDRNALPKTLRDMQGVLLGLSAVMVLTVTIAVLSSLSLAVAERRREFGVLKAVGMTPAQVTRSVLVGAAALALVASTVGLPAGIALTRVLTGGITRGVGLGPMDPTMPLTGLALLFPIVVLVAMVGAALPARSASRVSAVEVLRYE